MTHPLTIEWVDAGKTAQCPADPAFPKGRDLVDRPEAAFHCVVRLSYPTPRCGVWIVRCKDCGKSMAITAAGRADDPRTVSLACFKSVHGAVHA